MRASNWASEWRIAGWISPLTTPGPEVMVSERLPPASEMVAAAFEAVVPVEGARVTCGGV